MGVKISKISYVKLPKWVWVLNELMLKAHKEQPILNDSKPKEAVIMLER